MAVTVKDVARAAGVSLATAARALGDYGSVNEATRERVRAAAEQLGYVPNTIARALASGSTSAVGVVLSDVGNPFFGTIVRAMADVLDPRGYTLLLANSDEDPERERLALETLRARRVDGLIVVPASPRPTPHLRRAVEQAPLVLLDRAVRGLAVDSVTNDDVGGARAAAEHLLGHGHRRLAVVADNAELLTVQDRIAGFRAALADAGVAVDERLVVAAGPTSDGAYDVTRRLFEREDPPTALLATNIYMVRGAFVALRDMGLEVPRDVSVVAFDDVDWTSFVSPPLTVVRLPEVEMGRRCGELLLRRMESGPGRPRRVVLPVELVERGSCAPPRGA